ncbi:MAG: peptidyl-prolyl cis-trans isomerase [Sulfuricurvum sp.]
MRSKMALAKTALAGSLLAASLSAQTLVTVNGTAITAEDVEKELMVATQGRVGQIPSEKQNEFRQQILEQLVGRELVYDDAKKSGVLDSEEFKERYDEVTSRIKKEVAIQIWQKREVDKISISENDLKEYYEKNKSEFVEDESVKARHILVDSEAAAKDAIKDLKGLSGDALKDKFASIAKDKSSCASAASGGDLGYFTRDQMVPEFSAKAFSLPKGSISQEPVKSQFGYHVIFVEDKKPKTAKTYAEVKDFISQRLKMEKAKTVMLTKMQELEKKATIKQP